MKHQMFKKTVICFMIILLVGTSIPLNINANMQESDTVLDKNNEIMNVIETNFIRSGSSLSYGTVISPITGGNIEDTNKKKYAYDEMGTIGDMNAQLFDVYEFNDLGQAAWGLTSGDFNEDGNVDFAASTATSPFSFSTISIFYNDGNLGFTQEDVFTFTYSYIESLDSGDYDNDGDIDLMFSYSERNQNNIKIYGIVCILYNDGNNNFGNRTMITKRGSGIPYDPEGRHNPHITSADYDLDGDIDLLVGDNSGKVEFYLNNGLANFTSAGIIHDWGNTSWGLTSADYDNDGDIDFLVAAETEAPWGYVYLKRNQIIPLNLSICFDSGPGEILTDIYNLPGTASLTSLDYQNNGNKDFIAGIFWELYLYIITKGFYDPFLICRIPVNTEGQPEDLTFGALTSADYNNDGYDDFVAGGVQGVIRLFINNRGLAIVTRPYPNRLYIFDKESESPIMDEIIIIGGITIEVKGLVELQKVEFYIDRLLWKTDITFPFSWKWRLGGFIKHRRTIKIVAYDNSRNSSIEEIKVWKFL